MNCIFCFTDAFEYMQVISLHLDFSYFKTFCKSYCKRPHSRGEDFIVVCFNDEMDMVVLQRKVNHSKSKCPGVYYCPFQEPQTELIFDCRFELKVNMEWGVSGDFLPGSVSDAFRFYSLSSWPFSKASMIGKLDLHMTSLDWGICTTKTTFAALNKWRRRGKLRSWIIFSWSDQPAA